MASLASKLRTLRNTLEVFGPLIAVRAALAEMLSPKLETNRFDRRFGTETSEPVSVNGSRLPDQFREEARSYWPAVEPVVHHMLRRLPRRHEDLVFVDAGCGKGRAMLLASMYPFAKIIGVELSPLTSRIAQENLAIFRDRAGRLQKCTDIEVRCENILDFAIPDADVMFFLYNPFQGALFEAFMGRVHAFSDRHPDRTVLIAYCNPWSGEEWLQQSGCFRKTHEHRVIPHAWSWNFWEPVRLH